VTGALGKTGSRVISALAKRNAMVRAFIRRKDGVKHAKEIGATEIAIGDFFDDASLREAIEGCSHIIHICPPMNPKETDIAKRVTNHCLAAGADRLILYSVLHPLIREVPHHNNKLEAERYLTNSGLNYTILQPSRYMQHLVPIWNNVVDSGIHNMPFNIDSKFSIVDLQDLAIATAKIAVEGGHEGATYELAGPEMLSQIDMARILSSLMGKNIRAKAKSIIEFNDWAEKNKISTSRKKTMQAMNRHYDAHGLVTLTYLVGYLSARLQPLKNL